MLVSRETIDTLYYFFHYMNQPALKQYIIQLKELVSRETFKFFIKVVSLILCINENSI